MGGAADVDKAAKAARKAFATFSLTSREDRIDLLERIVVEYQKRYGEIADAITEEMGAPASLSQRAQAAIGIGHLQTGIAVLKNFKVRGGARHHQDRQGADRRLRHDHPLELADQPDRLQGVCRPLATGCTMVLKPSEVAPFSGYLWAEVLHAAGVPAGVFNLVNGDGPTVGAAISSHPEIDMVSFTGSTRAGIEVARAAAPTVKRVAQELGGKSPNIILDDAGLQDRRRPAA